MDQFQRIQRLTRAEAPPVVGLRVQFSATTSGDDVLRKVRHVMRPVAVAQVRGWPNDHEWRRRLPDWFLDSFDENGSAQCTTSCAEACDFGAWLGAMKDPGWQWWSCESDVQGGTVRVAAFAEPLAIEPLIHLLRACGASEIALDQQ